MEKKQTRTPESTDAKNEKPHVSDAVIRRLPRYFRYLRELMRRGQMRISSGDFAEMMGVTASQIRQDLNCFGGFGQQGYGYNVNYLYAKICELLGVSEGINAVIIGAGDLGRALVRSNMFEKRGVDIVAMFDVNPDLIGKIIGGVTVCNMDALEEFCEKTKVELAVFTVPKEAVDSVMERVTAIGIPGVWNFTAKDLKHDPKRVAVENVHLGDSLMILNYRICRLQQEKKQNEKEDGKNK